MDKIAEPDLRRAYELGRTGERPAAVHEALPARCFTTSEGRCLIWDAYSQGYADLCADQSRGTLDPRLREIVHQLAELRAAARDRRDFATADRIRAHLAAHGVTVEDTRLGQEVRGWPMETLLDAPLH